jgi:ADP-dependent NAD(P)H-hydrate dehydratase / NAD(P)H-hydrate epimerase
MKDLEGKAFGAGVSAEALMDSAGVGIAAIIQKEHQLPGDCLVYLGKGNNGGDALVATDRLQRVGWKIWLRSLVHDDQLGALPQKKMGLLAGSAHRLTNRPAGEHLGVPLIILDGLVGLGGRAGLSNSLKRFTQEINWCRNNLGAKVYAVDLPSGLAEDGIDADCVTADLTIAIGFVKEACVRDDATGHVGCLNLVDLPVLTEQLASKADRPFVSLPVNLRPLAGPRAFESHKGDYGRIGLLAGSPGFVGAAVLCSEAAARAGGGLVTVFVSQDIYSLVAGRMSAEIMVKPVSDRREILSERLDAIGLGPGLGHAGRDEMLEVIAKFNGPMVVDADGLNALSQNMALLERCAGPRLLTPHPGEMSRLWPDHPNERREIVHRFVDKYPVALLLKGARTVVGSSREPLAYNSTGTPGMATGGSGDVLTGICAALLGRGFSPFDAGRFGAWLAGRASELALSHQSEESMLPQDTIAHLGLAYQALRRI